MHKHVIIIVLAVLTTLATLTPQVALGQVDAKEAYLTGKKLFEQGKFEEARDLFLKASFTDNKNAEVFLALGKANYQIGEIDKAMAAWVQTLRLAPKEAYATRMLKALRGYTSKPAARIKLIKMLIAEDMHSTAGSHCQSLVRNEAATDAQRAEALRLHAEVLLETGKATSAVVALQEALAKYPTQQDKATTALLLGRARVKIGGKSLALGLDTLKSVVTDFAKTPQASAAQYELILAGLSQKTDAAGAASLKKWIAANATHRLADEATSRLVSIYLTLAGQTAKPKADAKLSQFEVQAITLAGKQIAKSLRTADAAAIHKLILTHIQKRYAAAKAYPAAISGVELLLKAPLPKTARAQTLMALAQLRATVAIDELNELARAGKLPTGNTPKSLSGAVAGFKAIMSEFPLQSTWPNIAVLSHKANTLAVSVPFGPKVTTLKAAHGWAIEIALDVIKADADAKAVTNAMTIVSNIQSQYASFSEAPANAIPLDINAKLLAAVGPDNSARPGLMIKQIDLLNIYASRVFAQNIKAGRDEANKTLSAHQNKMLATMTAILARDTSQAPAMLTRLSAHIKPWLARGHYDLARKAYAAIAAAMPASQKPSVQLAITGVWVSQANAASARLLAAGFTVPRKLDPAHIQALTACYLMQAQRRETDPIVLQARTIASRIVRHYTELEYFDIAEQAIAVKAKQAVDTADAFAQISLAGFHLQRARAELAESLKRYKAKDKIALTDAFKKAIGDYKKFITDRPTHSYTASAVQNIYGIARIFEQHKAYDVAIGVYKDFAAFAAKSKVLSQGSPASASQAEAAELVVANALYSKAENALTKSLADAKPNDPPPAKISAEFSAAIDAYKAFVKARPSSPLVGTAIARINKAAMKYVGIGSWDVAEGVFANLLAAGLDIRRPERIEFSRGLCRLGKVMPKHATDVLTAITAPRRGPSGGGVSAIAMGWGSYDSPDPVSVPKPAPKPVVTGPAPMGSAGIAVRPKSPADGGKLIVKIEKIKEILQEQKDLDDSALRKSDVLAMAAIRRQNTSRASRIARLRDEEVDYKYAIASKTKATGKGVAQNQGGLIAIPVLSDAEIARQEKFLFLAYDVFQSIRKKYPLTSTADQARGEIMVMIGHWRSMARWAKSAALVERFLADNPTDIQTPTLRMSIASDYLSWASQRVKTGKSTQEMLAEVARRFGKARTQLEAIVTDLPDEKTIVHQAQWSIANSFLTQARVVNAFSATLARGQYVRAGRELLKVAAKFHDHPQISTIPQMLWTISGELSKRGYHNEAIVVCTDLTNNYPTNALAASASLKIAQIYQNNLRRPLRAAEAYIELNFARGGNDAAAQAAMFQIGTQLKGEKRWVEALHVLESFVDSFPRHAQAGQALATVGQIHQANEAWDDAIAAYKRVISEFAGGVWVKEAKWSIAECTINLSRWREASDAYKDYVKTYAAPPVNAKKTQRPDARLAEATRRIGVLKDLARYQILVDEKGQRKAFDAQYQIATIVATQLSNPVKAIIEYRKVTAKWPTSHFADDALFKVGTTYLSMNETTKARKALLAVGAKYPNSPLADDALYMVGQSYETEAASLGAVTRAGTISKQRDVAQKMAYSNFAAGRRRVSRDNKKRIAQFKAGKDELNAELEQARGAIQTAQFNISNSAIMANLAEQQVAVLTAKQLADRQDKINASLRLAVTSYRKAAEVAAADKADESLLRMAKIYGERLKDSDAAMKTYLEIVRQFSGTSVAEDASWRIAQYYEQQEKAEEAVTAYKAFLRNYRRSSRAGAAQFAIAENYEHAGKWVQAMDAYTNYMTNFPKGPMVAKAKEQISWIKTYRL